MKHLPVLLGVLLAQGSPLFAADAKPCDAAIPVPPTSYRSVFEGYRPAAEEPVADWRTLNEEVAATGGHIGIMRGAAPQPPKPATIDSTGRPAAHGGHQH